MCGVESHLVLFVASCRRLQRELRFTTSCKICDSVVVADWPTGRVQVADNSQNTLTEHSGRAAAAGRTASQFAAQRLTKKSLSQSATSCQLAELSQNSRRTLYAQAALLEQSGSRWQNCEPVRRDGIFRYESLAVCRCAPHNGRARHSDNSKRV